MKAKNQPLFFNSSANITIRTGLDSRRKDEHKPISVIVTHLGKRYFYRTGERVTNEEYSQLLKAKVTSKSDFAKRKTEIQKIHLKIYDLVKGLMEEGRFSLFVLDELLNSKEVSKDITFYEYYMKEAQSKDTLKTRMVYNTAIHSFLKTYGAKQEIVVNNKGKIEKQPRMIIPDNALKLMPKDITASAIAKWQQQLKIEGKTAATISMYVRPIKTVLRKMKDDGLIKVVPDIKAGVGTRRVENYLSVNQILKLMGYKGKYQWAVDFWLMLYFCNGCNARDFLTLKWEEDYFQNNELSFIRSKTKSKSESLVLIPIIEPLQRLLSQYATTPQRGNFLFPVLLNNAKTEEQISIQANYLNARIREGIEKVCEELELPKVSASWARNSYITALTWHGISDAFIDNMTGHVGNNSLLRGYQGRISPTKRHRINSLLIVPPED